MDDVVLLVLLVTLPRRKDRNVNYDVVARPDAQLAFTIE
jgi:hypothetical protein